MKLSLALPVCTSAGKKWPLVEESKINGDLLAGEKLFQALSSTFSEYFLYPYLYKFAKFHD